MIETHICANCKNLCDNNVYDEWSPLAELFCTLWKRPVVDADYTCPKWEPVETTR